MTIQALEKAIENLEKRVEWLELQMRLVHRTLDKIDRKTEPQTNASQHVQRVEYVGNDGRCRCWKCKHFEEMHETPVASDGNYYTYVVCTVKECNYEPKTEPQTERGE